MSDDQRLQRWMEWYDRNQQRSEYRRQRYAMLTEIEREQIRAYKKKQYRKRIAAGWARPNREQRTDVQRVRYVAIGLLIQRDGRICGICGKEVEAGQESIDHIVPLNMGGTDDATNIRLAHLTCNLRRPRKPKELRLEQEAQSGQRPLLN